MNKDRLLRLAQLLEDDARNDQGVQFDLRDWALPAKETGQENFLRDTKVIPVSCNTKACAFGLAAISGIFKDEGLGYKIEPEGDGTGTLLPTYTEYTDSIGFTYTGFTAARWFFDLRYGAAEYLFNPLRYPESKLSNAEGELFVAQRIRDFVEKGDNFHE